jgi:transcriptional regulator with XRE-family HTH domain
VVTIVDVGRRIERAMRAKGMRLHELSERCLIPAGNLCRIMRHGQNLTIRRLRVIAQSLGVTCGSLLD